MAQDSDVARVAAAMNAPGFKYRSFGNEPVRIRPGAAGTLSPPIPEPAPFIDEPLPPPEPLPPMMDVAPALPPEPFAPPFAPEPLAYEDVPPPRYAYEELPGAPPAPSPSPPPAPAPVMVAEAPPPEPPLFSWPETPSNPSPAPTRVSTPSLLPPEVPQAFVPTPAPAYRQDPEPTPGGGFRLLESMGHRPGDDAVPRIAPTPAGGTLGLLRRATEGGATGGASQTSMGTNPGFAGASLPPLSPSGHQSGLLPAAAVTVPLSDVMRLIAAGATPPPSPFDAFRAALGAQPGR